MPSLRAILFLSLAVGTMHAQTLGVERRQDLGFGFHRDVIAERNPPGAFESVGHFEYLFYRNRKLCQLDECAVAPSGKMIIYQDGPSGDVFVFTRSDGKIAELKKFPGLVDRFVWHEQAGNVSAFVTRDSQAPLSTGKWITIALKPKT